MFERARLRLALWFAAVMAAVLLAVAVGAYLVTRNELDGEINRSLATAAGDLSAMTYRELGPGEAERGPGPRPRTEGRGFSTDVFSLVLNAEGVVVSNPRNLDVSRFPIAELQAPTDASGADVAWQDFSAGGERYRVAIVPAHAFPGGPTAGSLVVGRSLDARDYQLRLLAIVLAAGGIGGVLLAAGGGFWLAGRALVPIRRSLETQRRFLSDASHELRTPVAVMKANAELLLRHPEQTVEANIDQVAAINEESDHLTKLVGDLLMLARADEQRLEVSREDVDLDALLDGIVRDMTALADGRGARLLGQFAAGTVEGDPQRLRQLVAILLDNALKFTPAGGTIEVRASGQGSRVTIAVADTGRGIAAENLPRIFDRFYRADEARSPQPGAGLGLSIARWIAEAHGGRITVESVAGAGSTFTVRFPRGTPAKAPLRARAPGLPH